MGFDHFQSSLKTMRSAQTCDIEFAFARSVCLFLKTGCPVNNPRCPKVVFRVQRIYVAASETGTKIVETSSQAAYHSSRPVHGR